MKRIYRNILDTLFIAAIAQAVYGLGSIGVAAARARRRKTNY